VQIREPADIPAAIESGMESGGLLLDESQLGANFFDLHTGLAGEVLQKFTNYRVRLAIVVADAQAHGSRFSELVREHRSHAAVRFFDTEQRARQWLTYNPVVKC
jgi:PadR family transcriptional regulator AphA